MYFLCSFYIELYVDVHRIEMKAYSKLSSQLITIIIITIFAHKYKKQGVTAAASNRAKKC